MVNAYDVIIIGAGPAGLTAAVFAARARLKTIVFGFPEKSLLWNAQSIGNYIGTNDFSGQQWLEKGIEQIKQYGAEFEKCEVIHIIKNKGYFEIKTSGNRIYGARAVIIATGFSLKAAGIKNENEFLGKGIHTCVACDGWPYKNKKVAVVGHSNHAAEEAIELLAFTKNVTILSDGRDFEISEPLMKELKKNKIRLLKDKIAEFKGKGRLEKIILKDGTEVACDGTFLALGTSTALAFAQKLALDSKDNFIVVNSNGQTSIEGVYAAGGCVGGNLQIAKSAGDGCTAAISVIKKLKGLTNYSDLT